MNPIHNPWTPGSRFESIKIAVTLIKPLLYCSIPFIGAVFYFVHFSLLMQSITSAPLTHEITRTHFGYYMPDEIKKLSVKKITSPVAFDGDGKPMPE